MRTRQHVPFNPGITPEEASETFYQTMCLRRSVRVFSDRPVSRVVIERVIAAAGTAPSGANKQPWKFVAVSNPAEKWRIREAAEVEERGVSGEENTPAT